MTTATRYPASLETIPAELKNQILVHLSSADVLSLSKTSRTLREASLPALYGNVALSYSRGVNRLKAFFRTMLERPMYSMHIRHLQFLGWPELDAHSISEIFNQDPSILQELLSRLSRAESLRTSSEFLRSCHAFFETAATKSGIRNAKVGSIISQFRSLKTVVLRRHRNADEESICNESGKSNVPFKSLVNLLLLPSLDHLDVSMVLPYDDSQESLDNISISSSLRKLRLDHAFAVPRTLKLLLGFTPFLEELEYDLQMPSKEGVLWLNTLKEAIDQVQSTLQCLTIRFGVFVDQAIDPASTADVTSDQLGPMVNFTALKDLNVSLAVLYGRVRLDSALPLAEMLPRSLRCLTINDDLWDYYDFHEWLGAPVMRLLEPFLKTGWKFATPEMHSFTLDARAQSWIVDMYWRQEWIQDIQEVEDLNCRVLLEEE